MVPSSRRLVLVALCACGLLLATQLIAGDDKEAKPPEWRVGNAGLEHANEQKQIAILVWGGRDQEAFWERFDATVAGSRPLQKRLAKMVRIRINDRTEEAVVATIGYLDDKSTIAVLDFRGVTVDRWNGEIPKLSVLNRAIKKAAKRNEAIAKQYRIVEKIVKKSRYAHRLKKPRDAIQLLLEGEKVPLPPDSQPVKDLAEIRAELDAECSEKLEEAQEMEEERKLVAALDKYQEIQRAYPFPKRKMEITRHIGRVTRLLGIGN